MADTRTLTIRLGAASFSFEILETVEDYYAEDEIVYIKYRIRNNGAVTGAPTIECIDVDTGNVITRYQPGDIEPGYAFETTGTHARLGAMPDHDWDVRFELTP